MCANCRDTESLKHYNATGDKYETDFDCGWENGLICATHTNGKTCKDYEVKFKCPTIGTCPECAKWTPWLNREHGGLQDRELVGPEGHNPCSDHEPLDIQCRVRGTNQPWDQAGQKIRVKCTPSEGFACDIADQQIEQNCYDYEVRFLCP
ncbi:cartilage intermediate layer protein 1 [Lingula anatina]|uniref:Cartilage intermediate layer protein 1 n=1 Tax=Lingula anatina TaxID=7574 RepID=A0A1S3IV32_LINAN|nr:cartilage intermediate layer protein 1 [Lingula anatina]|eukprot:XP_013401801.1 cartilage intermediate layer protein 1 [Lingula anatina]